MNLEKKIKILVISLSLFNIVMLNLNIVLLKPASIKIRQHIEAVPFKIKQLKLTFGQTGSLIGK